VDGEPPFYVVKLGTVRGATGVHVRNHVFWYAMRTSEVWVRGEAMSFTANMLALGTWERNMVPPHTTERDREQLLLLWGMVWEMDGVRRDWPMRGFGTRRVQRRPVRRQAHHENCVCVVLRDGDGEA